MMRLKKNQADIDTVKAPSGNHVLLCSSSMLYNGVSPETKVLCAMLWEVVLTES